MRPLPLLLLLAACRYPAPATSFLVIQTDDQRADTLWVMDIVRERLAAEGVTFTDAHVTVPMCCPERTSFLSGGWHPTRIGVISNEPPNGGFVAFRDVRTLPRKLQAEGWATGLFGKYLNGYEDDPLYVPPGWTSWVAITAKDGWDRVEYTQGSSAGEPGEGVSGWRDGYVTETLGDDVEAFLDAHADDPFFLFVTPPEPHVPVEPAAQDDGAYAGYDEWRGPGFNESDVSDKPAWLQEEAALGDPQVAALQVVVEDQLESLLAVDRLVGRLLDALEAHDRLDDTVIVFTSDNGYFWGEHRLEAKGAPYAEAVRVPLVVRWPGGVRGVERADLAAVNLDVAATVLDAAGLSVASDGESLASVARDGGALDRDTLLVEGFSGDRPVWTAAVSSRWKYVTWETGDTELYDRAADPWEMESLAASPPDEADVAGLSAWLDERRGLAITTRALGTVAEGADVDLTLTAWGGMPPYTWSAEGLPEGVTLSTDGHLSGTPVATGTHSVSLAVTDTSVSPWDGRAQAFHRDLPLIVGQASAALAGPPVATRLGPDTAELRVTVVGRGRLKVRWSGEPSMDLLPQELGPIEASGEVRARLSGDVGAWEVWLDGVRVAAGGVR